MDVVTIIANVKDLALLGNTGDVSDNDRVLRYLNNTYSAAYAKLAQVNPSLFQRFQDVAITSGIGTFPNPTLSILSVADKNNGYRLLEPRTMASIEQEDPGLSYGGAPSYYDRTINGLYTYPINNTLLQLRYVPNPGKLVMNSPESDIMLPVPYHELLVWGTLYALAYDERDRLTSAELAETQKRYDWHMDRLVQWGFAQRPPAERRVRGSW